MAGTLFFVSIITLLLWLRLKAPIYKIGGKDGKSGLTPEVFNAIPRLYFDKEFVKDFVVILQREFDLENIVAKSQTKYYALNNRKNTNHRDIYLDIEDYQDLIRGNWDGDGFDPDAKRIAHSVIKSNGYKSFAIKFKFTKYDHQDMFCVIYYIITRPDFVHNAKKYLYTAVNNDEKVKITPLPKEAFDNYYRDHIYL